MEQTLLALEKAFFQLKYTSNRAWLAEVLHDDFLECGKSGGLYHKEETMEALLALTEDRGITMYNFTCEALGACCWLVHYMTCIQGRWYYRTSVWRRETEAGGAPSKGSGEDGCHRENCREDVAVTNGLKLRFHQASPINDETVRELELAAW